jgi:hypothetical protein
MNEKLYCKILVSLMLACLLCIVVVPAFRTSRAFWTFVGAQIIGIAVNLLYIQFRDPVRRRLGILAVLPARMLFRFLLFSPVFYFVGFVLFDIGERRSALCIDAIHLMQESDIAKRDLGVPLKIGWPIQGKTYLEGGSGNSALLIAVSGSHGEGTLRVVSRKTHGIWTIDELTLTMRDIDISENLKKDEPESGLVAR